MGLLSEFGTSIVWATQQSAAETISQLERSASWLSGAVEESVVMATSGTPTTTGNAANGNAAV